MIEGGRLPAGVQPTGPCEPCKLGRCHSCCGVGCYRCPGKAEGRHARGSEFPKGEM